MRDRLIEFMPLLLVGVVLLAFQLSRDGAPPFQLPAFPDLTPTPAVSVAAQPATQRPARPTLVVGVCHTAHPRFSDGMAALKAVVGSSMGEPVECEHATNPQGDTQQKTTTGLAYYRKEQNRVCFTTGWDHWALVDGSLVHWSSHAIDPPQDALAAPAN